MPDVQESLEGLKPGEYWLDTRKSGEVVGRVRCSKPGLRLIDFYRTSSVLAKDAPRHMADLEANQQKAKECAK